MSGGTIDLREKSYEKTKEISQSKRRNVVEIIYEIENFIIYNKPKLITDIESGKLSRKSLEDEIDKYIKAHNVTFENEDNYVQVLEQVNSYIWGYGPLQEYLDDKDISDVSIKGIKNDSWIKVKGKRKKVPIEFLSAEKLEEFCYLVSIKNGGNLSKVNAKQILSDSKSIKGFNLRIVVTIPPINSPTIIIRKIPKDKLSLSQLVDEKMLDLKSKEYLERIIKAGANILICGKGASGKSTLFNALIEEIPEEESKIMVQESEELTSKKGNWIWRYVVKANGESNVQYSLQDGVNLGLLEDLDRIYIGEIKGQEAMDLLDAGYTGHIVGFTTHAYSELDAIEKTVINMQKSNTRYERESLIQILARVIDVVVFIKNFKIRAITEVEGYYNNEIKYKNVVKYNMENEIWENSGTSCEKVLDKIKVYEFNNRE